MIQQYFVSVDMRSTIFFELCTLSQKLVQKVAKKRTLNLKIYCTVKPPNSGHPK